MSEPTSPASVPVRLVKRPTVTESAVGTAPPTPPKTGEIITITLDGRPVEVTAGQWIIAAAEEAGVYIPRFCYHPRMKPVGMCRMCLVEVDGPRGSSLMPACYNPVTAGMEIRTASPMAKKAQEGVLEFLLVNHPLDCPVCDKGGECPLQDQTLAYGPGESRFVEEKRHWEKPIAISELVYLDRERCIQCGRCVRFADEVAGDPLIDFAERGDRTEVATSPDEPYSLLLQRQRGADLPGRGPDGEAVPLQGPAVGPGAGREHVHDVLGRLPGGGAVQLGGTDPAHRRRLRSGQLGLAVRQGPLRLRGVHQPERV